MSAPDYNINGEPETVINAVPWADPQSIAAHANPFIPDPQGFSFPVPSLPAPDLGGIFPEMQDFGWSTGFGQAFPQSAPFEGAYLDPQEAPLAANTGGTVGLTNRTQVLQEKLAAMFVQDSPTTDQMAADYNAYFGGGLS